MSFPAISAWISGGALLILRCGFQPVDTVPLIVTPESGLIKEEHYFYTNESKDTLFTFRTVAKCIDGTMKKETKYSSFPMALSDNLLRIGMLSLDRLSSPGVRVNVDVRFERISGTGIDGYWKKMEISFDSTLLSASDIQQVNSMILTERLDKYAWLYFNQNTLDVFFYADATPDLAAFVFGTRADSLDSAFLITMTRHDTSSIELVGNISGESVSVKRLENGDVVYMLYKSSVPIIEYVCEKTPTKCPNTDTPDWFTMFMESNRKTG